MKLTKFSGFARPCIAVMALILGASPCMANDSFNSEFSHVVSGGLIAGAAAKYADQRGAEDPGWVGFKTSVGISFVMEGVQILTTGHKQIGPSTLDFASNMLGAAIGTWVANRYFLAPIVSRDAQGHRMVGLTLQMPL